MEVNDTRGGGLCRWLEKTEGMVDVRDERDERDSSGGRMKWKGRVGANVDL